MDCSYITAFVVTALALSVQVVVNRRRLVQFPFVAAEESKFSQRRDECFKHLVAIFHRGYLKFKDSAWWTKLSDGDVLVLPLKYSEELRKLPDDVINNVITLDQTVETQHTGVTGNNPHMIHVIKADLTQNLPRINLALSSAVERTVPEIIGPCLDWTATPIQRKLLEIVAIVSGHVFLGPELCRRPEYLYASINFTTDVFQAATDLKHWPRWMRAIVKHWLPNVAKVHDHRKRAYDFLTPVIQERIKLRDGNGPSEQELPDDTLQWLVNKAPKFNVDSVEQLAETQLVLSLAAIHTTTSAATQTIYDIVGTCPEIVPALRQEIRTVVSEHGAMSTKALFQMKLLDSVMRESQRLNSVSVDRMSRKVLKPFTFSDGLHVPAGITIAVPLSPVLKDDRYYSNPTAFDPYRFMRLRSGEVDDPLQYSNKEQYQFVSVTKENMNFGWGRHACPGRFFAANEIKLICARILLDYDIKLPDPSSGRFANLSMGPSIAPDPTKDILIRSAR